MASQVLTNCVLWLAGYKLSGAMNALGLDYGAELQDATVFGDTGRRRRGGLKTQAFHHEGYWDVGTGAGDAADEVLFPLVGAADKVMTISPNGVEGEPAYTLRSVAAEYSPGAQVGQMFKFTVRGEGAPGDPLVEGTLLKNAAVSVDGNGTAFDVGAVSATQKLYAALQFTGAALGTAYVQSAPTSGFVSPTQRVLFALGGSRGTDWQVVAGPITDAWWRAGWTASGSAEIVVTIAIL
ncbi:MAG TPA: hypothetical protein VGV13_13800 [Methylomirabilota bacterium]|jgi:hypothetical protein|nr:hypothetical protein [Methylomirabilota bacterium]